MPYRYSHSWQKQVVVISIIMQSTSQKVNALKSIIGIFFHSCKTPEKVIVSCPHGNIDLCQCNSLGNHILSMKSVKVLCDLGQTLLSQRWSQCSSVFQIVKGSKEWPYKWLRIIIKIWRWKINFYPNQVVNWQPAITDHCGWACWQTFCARPYRAVEKNRVMDFQ